MITHYIKKNAILWAYMDQMACFRGVTYDAKKICIEDWYIQQEDIIKIGTVRWYIHLPEEHQYPYIMVDINNIVACK